MTDVGAILAAVPGFESAEVRAVLSDGPTNSSYRIELGGECFVLRVDKPAAAQLGLDRDAERVAYGALAAAGLAEAPLVFDTGRGVMLRRFVAGRSWSAEDVARPDRLVRLARLLRTLHAVPRAGRRFEPLAAARRYAEQVGTPAARAVYEQAASAQADVMPAAPVLCHNDPVCGNVLETGAGLRLIDWEYAGDGDAFFDLAVVVEHHDIGPAMARDFLAAYLGGEPGRAERARLQQQRRFYRQLLALWRMRTAVAAAR